MGVTIQIQNSLLPSAHSIFSSSWLIIFFNRFKQPETSQSFEKHWSDEDLAMRGLTEGWSNFFWYISCSVLKCEKHSMLPIHMDMFYT